METPSDNKISDDSQNTQQSLATPPNPAHRSRKKWLLLASLALVLIVATGVGAYFLDTNNSNSPSDQSQNTSVTPTLAPQTVNDPTANWKTYISSELNFTFKYPQNWDHTELEDKSMVFAPQAIVDDIGKIPGGFGGGPDLISVLYIQPEPTYTYVTDEFQTVTQSQVTVGGKQVTQYITTVTKASPLGEPGTRYLTTVIPVENMFVKYSLLDSDYTDTYNQILSTFKFTDSTTNSTDDWKTYTSRQNTFTIKYPSDQFVRYICPNEELLLALEDGTNAGKEIVMENCARDGMYDIEVREFPKNGSVQQPDEYFDVKEEKIFVSGVSATKYTVTQIKDPQEPFPTSPFRQFVLIPYKGVIYEIHISNLKLITTFNKMVSSYQLIR